MNPTIEKNDTSSNHSLITTDNYVRENKNTIHNLLILSYTSIPHYSALEKFYVLIVILIGCQGVLSRSKKNTIL
jgi:hypothetical protein